MPGDPLDELLAYAVAAVIARHRQPWWADALCKEYPAVSFFPGRGESTAPAKDVCGRCLVRAECHADAVEHDLEGRAGWDLHRGAPQAPRRLTAREAALRPREDGKQREMTGRNE